MPGNKLRSEMAGRLANLALQCVSRQYPNKLGHVLNGDADVKPPRELTPAFYGCYDWHSAVHNHWLLARVARFFPGEEFAGASVAALERNLKTENVRREVEYMSGEGRQSFERPYGLAWVLQLAQELSEWASAPAQRLSANLLPLEEAAVERLARWLAQLPHPVRTGEHNQTAFALGLMIDYARQKNTSFFDLLADRSNKFYGKDENWPVAFEPSGEDFLSPGLAEADVMRRVLSPKKFVKWLNKFFPGKLDGLHPVIPPDRSDPKFSHLDGLNLSRAWMLEGIASALQERRKTTLMKIADGHRLAGLEGLSSRHYVGSHWLGTFAVYLLTGRGLSQVS